MTGITASLKPKIHPTLGPVDFISFFLLSFFLFLPSSFLSFLFFPPSLPPSLPSFSFFFFSESTGDWTQGVLIFIFWSSSSPWFLQWGAAFLYALERRLRGRGRIHLERLTLGILGQSLGRWKRIKTIHFYNSYNLRKCKWLG
jgi:hypothetical protein